MRLNKKSDCSSNAEIRMCCNLFNSVDLSMSDACSLNNVAYVDNDRATSNKSSFVAYIILSPLVQIQFHKNSCIIHNQS